MSGKARENELVARAGLKPTIFLECLMFTLGLEGERVDDDDDRGGRTAFGVRQQTYDTWRTLQGRPRRDVWAIAPLEVMSIYRLWYWEQARGPDLEGSSPSVAFVLFDAFVHHGARTMGKVVQEHVGLPVDGLWGPKTWGAIDAMVTAHGEVEAGHLLLDWRRQKCREIAASDATQVKWLTGWLNRMDAIARRLGPRLGTTTIA